MHRFVTRLLATALVAALAASLGPLPALAATRGRVPAKARASAGASLAAVRLAALVTVPSAVWPPDAADSADDTWTAAVEFPSMPAFDGSFETTARAFYKADGTAESGGDQDWWRFTVDDVTRTYLFEAITGSTTVDPVIEVYKADAGGSIAPTPVDQLAYPAADPNAVALNDDGMFLLAGTSASLSFSPETTGTYYLRVRPVYFDVTGFASDFGPGAGPYQFRAKVGTASRIGGADFVETAVAVSREMYPTNYGPDLSETSPTVVVTNGTKFSDALPGSVLAYAVDGPMLMLPNIGVPAAVSDEIRRFGASRVIILGGTGTVSAAQEASLAAIPGVTRVERVSGRDRYEVARRIALKTESEFGGVAPFAFIVNASKYPDALSAASMAAFNVAPILYTSGTRMDTDTMNNLSNLGVTDVCIVGGTASVSSATGAALQRRFGASHVKRIGGANRYIVSKDFARWACEMGAASPDGSVGTNGSPAALAALDPRYLGVSSGEVFAEPLAGSTLCGMAGVPMILTPKATLSPYIHKGTTNIGTMTDWVTDVANSTALPPQIERAYVFGGTSIVTDDVLQKLDLRTGAGALAR